MKNTKESISTLSGRIDSIAKTQEHDTEASRFWIRTLALGVVVALVGYAFLYFGQKKPTPSAPQFVTCVVCNHAVAVKASKSIPVMGGIGETFTAQFCAQHAPTCDRITTPLAVEAHALEWRDFWQYERTNSPYRRVNADGSEFDPPKPRVITEYHPVWVYTNRPIVTNTVYVTNICQREHLDLWSVQPTNIQLRVFTNQIMYLTNDYSFTISNWPALTNRSRTNWPKFN